MLELTTKGIEGNGVIDTLQKTEEVVIFWKKDVYTVQEAIELGLVEDA